MNWPTPEQAYAHAPSITDENHWLNNNAADWHDTPDREWYLRNAALYDRIALREESGKAVHANATAIYLLDLDGAPRTYPPRDYVRHQYALMRAMAADELAIELTGGCGLCDTTAEELCAACDRCRCDRHDTCTRPTD